MLYYLKDLSLFWGPFRLFEYQTFRAMLAGAVALLIGFAIAPYVLRRLRDLRQPERDAKLMGELARQGGKVPTMGGILVLVPSVVAVLLCAQLNVHVVAALVVYLGMSAVGWIDDYRKVKFNSSDGISGRAKMGGQIVFALAAVAVLLCAPSRAVRVDVLEVWVPFVKTAVLSADALPWALGAALAMAFFCVVTVGASNAVNLTDGLDGLAIGCVISTTMIFGIVAYLSGHAEFASYLHISHVSGAGELAVLCAALLGGSMVFLWYNAAPAEVYMGDVGALGLGGAIGAVAFMTNHPFLLVIVGGVFVAEALSVILQVAYFKRTGGQRIFLMTPIHHHFQKKGWPVTKIVIRFWLLSLLCGIVGLITLKLR
ncbi:MAG: phospho-N-acetylmuramoyl-pentapeptide-transferase [Puniceicoccales bacterium]|jgi:phospho-N-acetylmuramoyl-pentapeptide-transferase|nr:phospho-N-acetylmuramoyl-pentapeptide-transferase [Puniceicoccales bacterium]